MAFHPYLFFGGNCRQAFERYEQIFGGDLTLLTNADMPVEDQMPSVQDDLIVHAALMIGDQLLMGSDAPTEEFGPVRGMMVNFSVTGADEADRVFTALADGGEVTMPIAPTSWSPKFGMCVDRFGTPWMISAEGEPVTN